MLQAPVLAYERTGVWAAALRVSFARRECEPPRIIETRTPDEFRSRVVESRREGGPPALPVIELTAADPRRACEGLTWHVHEGGDVPRVAVMGADAATEAADEYEAAAREAGATLVVASTRDVDAIVETYRRYVADVLNRANLPFDDNRSPNEQIRDSLPWGGRDD